MNTFEHIPADMRSRRQWVLWRYEHRNGKPSKIPYQINGARASSVDPLHWVDFETAIECYKTKSDFYDGAGFVFSGSFDDWVGVDLDGCLIDGNLADWAREILDKVPGYAEISPSGRGCKIFCRGTFPADRGRKVRFDDLSGVELYARGRYFTVTGALVGTPSAKDATEGLSWLAGRYFPSSATQKSKSEHTSPKGHTEPVDRAALPYAAGHKDAVRAIERAEAYADKYPAAVSGQDGHGVTFRLACVLVNGFALDRSAALGILHRWNMVCDPPWSTKELDHKIDSAMDQGDKDGDRGYMLVDRDWGVEPAQLDEYEVFTGDLIASYESALNSDFPADLLNVPGFVSDVARWVTTQNPRPNPILSMLAGVALQAILVARKVKDKTGLRTNLYIVALAPSSGGKQAPQTGIIEILGLTGQPGLYGGKVASDSAIAQDLTLNPAKLYIFDEFGRFLQKTQENRGGSHLHAVQEILLELWGSTRNPLWKHKSMADSKFNREASYPCVSFLGFSVPENFWDGLEESHLHDGFAARLLVVDTGTRPDSRSIVEASPPVHILERAAYWRDFSPGGNMGAANHFDPLVIQTTDEAEKLFDDLVAFQETKEGATAEAIWSRSIEKARRLALIYSCSRDHERPVVDAESARWAIRFVKWATETFLSKASEEVTGGEVFQLKYKRVLKLIRDKSKRRNICTRSILLKATKWRARDLDEVLSSLKESDQITETIMGEGKTARLAYKIKK